jgi:transcription termination/antitermination protein NusG
MPADSSGMQGPEKDKFNFSKGQAVRIVDGPFAEYIGTVSEGDREQKKVTVLISFFGKMTPVVLNFFQVEKIEPFLT